VARRYGRDSVEFARVLTFNDGLYAIAMTLLIVSIAVPTISDTQSVSDLAEALNDLTGEYFENPLSIVIYAVNVGIVSAMEVARAEQARA